MCGVVDALNFEHLLCTTFMVVYCIAVGMYIISDSNSCQSCRIKIFKITVFKVGVHV